MGICLAIADADFQLTKDVVEVISSLVSVVGVCAALCFGLKGLSAWRKQLKGNFDHALAVRVMVELYRLRDSVYAARVPMFTLEELAGGETVSPLPDPNDAATVISRSLKSRYEKLAAAKAKLEIVVFECEAAWGGDFKYILGGLYNLCAKLKEDVDCYIYMTDPAASSESMRLYTMFKGARTNIMLNDGGKPSSEFSSEFESLFGVLENYLRRKLA